MRLLQPAIQARQGGVAAPTRGVISAATGCSDPGLRSTATAQNLPINVRVVRVNPAVVWGR